MIDGGTVMLVLRMGVSLALVLGILVLVVRFLERRGIGRGGSARGRRGIEVLQRAPLGKNASVQVVRVGERVLVLGVTDSSVRVLTDLDRADVEGEGDMPGGDLAALRELGATTTSRPIGIGGRDSMAALRAVTRRQDSTARTIVGRLSQGEGRHRVGRAGRKRE